MIVQGKISNQEAGYLAPNGRKWALCDCNFDSQCLAYYMGTWFSADSSSANYYSSKDGITWTKLTMPSGGPTTKCVSMISSTAGIFVYTETPGIVYQTENGTTWHTFAVGETDSMSLKKLYVVGDKILLLLSNGKLNIIGNWRSSSSSLTFVASNVNDLEYYNGKFVAATSTAGIIFNEACNLATGWHSTETDMNLNYTSITHKGKYWYATQEFSNSVTGYRDLYLVYSLDCVNWTKAQVSNSDLILPDNLKGVFFNIEYGNGIYTATTNISPANNGYIFTSIDGINFEQKVIDKTFSSQRIKYINGVFIYGGNTQHKVKYSLNSKDLFDTNISRYNTGGTDYIEDEHKGVIVSIFDSQLFYSLTDGTQKNFNTIKPPKIVSWKNGTVEEISAMLNAHYAGLINIADYWEIGNNRQVMMQSISAAGPTGEGHDAQLVGLTIIGMNHDNLKNPIGTRTKAAITVQTFSSLNRVGSINSNDTGGDNALWSKSPRRTWCNNNFIEALPIANLIKPVIKLSNRHATGNSSYRQQEKTEDYAFLLSQWEIWGKQVLDSSFGILPAEGTQYDYMKKLSNRKKYCGDDYSSWWSRTSYVFNSNKVFFLHADKDGGYAWSSSITGLGIAPAFCL